MSNTELRSELIERFDLTESEAKLEVRIIDEAYLTSLRYKKPKIKFDMRPLGYVLIVAGIFLTFLLYRMFGVVHKSMVLPLSLILIGLGLIRNSRTRRR